MEHDKARELKEKQEKDRELRKLQEKEKLRVVEE
jgi:hypothetical protein